MDCAWGGGGIEVELSGGDPGGYFFGLAETRTGGDAWTGEDCLYGYTTSSGTVYSYCHPLSAEGGFLVTVESILDVFEGSTTLHSAVLDNTYYLAEAATGDCWVFGHDTSYYGGLGCLDLGGGCQGE
ncbi:hypothetical protein L6R53_21040 [Myxococcota bacterium]|nr:hypothetical protein [Myxococcota bacterium]